MAKSTYFQHYGHERKHTATHSAQIARQQRAEQRKVAFDSLTPAQQQAQMKENKQAYDSVRTPAFWQSLGLRKPEVADQPVA